MMGHTEGECTACERDSCDKITLCAVCFAAISQEWRHSRREYIEPQLYHQTYIISKIKKYHSIDVLPTCPVCQKEKIIQVVRVPVCKQCPPALIKGWTETLQKRKEGCSSEAEKHCCFIGKYRTVNRKGYRKFLYRFTVREKGYKTKHKCLFCIMENAPGRCSSSESTRMLVCLECTEQLLQDLHRQSGTSLTKLCVLEEIFHLINSENVFRGQFIDIPVCEYAERRSLAHSF